MTATERIEDAIALKQGKSPSAAPLVISFSGFILSSGCEVPLNASPKMWPP
jgi:hypothetical protein